MKPLLNARIRLGKIQYTNCVPFYHGLEEKTEAGYSFFEAVPAVLNKAMAAGQIDIAPISSLEYLNHQKDYLILPGLSISSRDFSGSVLLLSKEKIEGLGKEKIGLSPESLSSSVLLQILLRFKYKFNNRFEVYEKNPKEWLEKNQAGLVIGDQALFYQSDEFIYKYDLSELWWNWTEKPFCFALWAVRKSFAKKHPLEVTRFVQSLRENLHANVIDLESLVREVLGMTFLDPHFSKVFGYLFNLSYGFDDSIREGLELFYRLAARLDVSPRPKPLEFFEMKA